MRPPREALPEDSGAISVRRLEIAQATRRRRASKSGAPKPICARRRKSLASAGDNNTQLQSALAAVEKAELDLSHTRVLAPARGMVTDLRVDVGHFAQPALR